MQDRVPLYPGRVTLTPVAGQANTYDMTRADQPTQEGTPLNKATLLQDATAALFGLGTDAVPNQVLSILSSAALYKNVPLSEQPEGAIVYLEENSSLVPFIVSKQNYEPSYNTNRVLLARTSGVQTGAWNSAGTNALDGSTMDTWFNTTYLQMLGAGIQNAIGQTNIPYTPKNGVNTVQRINKAVFTLSLTELNIQNRYTNIEGSALPIASTLKQLNQQVWTRSPVSDATNRSFYTHSNGIVVGENVTRNYYYYRPCFTLPGDFTGYLPSEGAGLSDVFGNVFMKLPAVQFVTGSYVGTGTYGSGNPNSLTFDTLPKVIFISGERSPVVAYAPKIGILINNNSEDAFVGFSFGGGSNASAGSSIAVRGLLGSFSENEVNWYGSNKENQLNSNGITYHVYSVL